MKRLTVRCEADFEKAVYHGRILKIEVASRVLAGNRFGDPAYRIHYAYISPHLSHSRLPAAIIYGLPTYGRGAKSFFVPEREDKKGITARIDGLLATGTGNFVFVGIDCLNALGGNQYTDSAAGAYETHVVREAIPVIEAVLAKHVALGRRAILGTSSGGFGALYLAMRYPEIFSAVACHSGDAGFEYSYIPEVPKLIGRLNPGFESDDEKLWDIVNRYRSGSSRSPGALHDLVLLGAAASYSPDEGSTIGFRMPFDLVTGELDHELWRRWLSWDPVALVEVYSDALASLRFVFCDCGDRDQYGLHLGARQIDRKLDRLGIAHVYEEFAGTHTDIEHRYEQSIPLLVAALL